MQGNFELVAPQTRAQRMRWMAYRPLRTRSGESSRRAMEWAFDRVLAGRRRHFQGTRAGTLAPARITGGLQSREDQRTSFGDRRLLLAPSTDVVSDPKGLAPARRRIGAHRVVRDASRDPSIAYHRVEQRRDVATVVSLAVLRADDRDPAPG